MFVQAFLKCFLSTLTVEEFIVCLFEWSRVEPTRHLPRAQRSY